MYATGGLAARLVKHSLKAVRRLAEREGGSAKAISFMDCGR